MIQMDLLAREPPPEAEIPPPAPGLETKFAAFDKANPHIWRLFVAFTFGRIKDRFKHYGARDVIHRIRWETDSAETPDEGFKINNIWSPWYARKFHHAFPERDGFFRTRAAAADAEAESP